MSTPISRPTRRVRPGVLVAGLVAVLLTAWAIVSVLAGGDPSAATAIEYGMALPTAVEYAVML